MAIGDTPMSRRGSALHVSILVLCILGLSCSSSPERGASPVVRDGRYDSEFPSLRSSRQLEQIAETVKMITAIAYYRTFAIELAEHIQKTDVTPEFLEAREKDAIYVNKSLSGTATIIWAEGRRVALLTCAHIVAFPDTEITYHIGPDRRPTPFLKTFSIKERQMNFVGILPEGGDLEILAIDRGADVAIMGKLFEQSPSIPIPVFSYPVGRASDLEWGTFVYLFGYPSGYRIVTSGLVSNPNRDKRGSFLLDAVIGGGFSGGIAVAVRDGVPNFELVGMVKMVSARTSYVLRPQTDDSAVEYDPTVPYTGEVYVDRHTDIEYGVSQAVPVEAVLEVLEANRASLVAQGFFINLRKSPAR